MGKRFMLMMVGLIAAATVAAPAAGAATEVGSNCVPDYAEESPESLTYLPETYRAGSPLPPATPVTGVATQWKMTVPVEGTGFGMILKAFRPTGVPNEFQLTAESSPVTLAAGVNLFPTRIPVQGGDRFGLTGVTETPLCKSNDVNDVIGAITGPIPLGATKQVFLPPKFQVPVAALVEPDADSDGYGDETQDKCPQGAAVQTACPVVTLDSFSIAKKRSVTLLVTTSTPAPVRVTGTVKLGKGKVAKLSASVRTVAPGAFGRFKLKFPARLITRLKALAPKRSLRLTIAARATNVAGQVSADSTKLKLAGQG